MDDDWKLDQIDDEKKSVSQQPTIQLPTFKMSCNSKCNQGCDGVQSEFLRIPNANLPHFDLGLAFRENPRKLNCFLFNDHTSYHK